jgi:glycosyltransferase involved in cell wall biosynthesis
MTRGDQLTVAHLLSYLHARGHDVDFFTLDTGGEMTADQRQWLGSVCRRSHVFEHGTSSILRGIVAASFTGIPIQVGYFRNIRLMQSLSAAIQENAYDIIYAYYLRSAPAVPTRFSSNRLSLVGAKPVAAFLALQLSQTLNTRRIYENERSTPKRLFYGVEWKRLRRYEAIVWRQYTKTVLIGPRDVDDIRTACRLTEQPEIDNWVLAAHGTDIEKFQPAQAEEIVPGRVVFSGSMRYQPNVQAALWFVERCWSSIRYRVPDAQLFIVGQSPVAALRALDGRDGIRVTGSVADIGEYIRSAAVCINPMLAAGGMQNKLIEYKACGKAVVATSIANEGIRAPLTSLVIADDADAFADSTIRLLGNRSEALALGGAAREYVEQEWTWEGQFANLERAFYEALAHCEVAE